MRGKGQPLTIGGIQYPNALAFFKQLHINIGPDSAIRVLKRICAPTKHPLRYELLPNWIQMLPPRCNVEEPSSIKERVKVVRRNTGGAVNITVYITGGEA
jgi:hypothetical protein